MRQELGGITKYLKIFIGVECLASDHVVGKYLPLEYITHVREAHSTESSWSLQISK